MSWQMCSCLLYTSNREQQRIGQDLHDGLCQELTGIELMCQVLEQKLAAKSKAESERAGEIARHIRDAISHTRKLARGLSPVELEANGFMSALHELAAPVSYTHLEVSPPDGSKIIMKITTAILEAQPFLNCLLYTSRCV